jgi:hypothetical protein
MRKVLQLLTPVLFFYSTHISAQLLHGRVLNESGGNAAGVVVSFQNKTNSSITRSDGTFKITATHLPDTLVFSAAGFEPYKVIITEKNFKDPNFEVVLLKTRKTLNEVVVRSMGMAREKKELSYSTVSTSDGLEGKVSGVEVSEDARYMRLPKSASPDYRDSKLFFSDTNIAPREGALAKSRILTAGEVNDFNKWKMWEDYSENEFKSFSNLWGMKTSQRFSLQLTGKNHKAVMGEQVFLINKNTMDTVWRTYTDNTGKAELWANFLNDSTAKGDYYISDSYRHTLFNPSAFANGVNVLAVEKTCQLSNDADIAFVVDATGSMKDEIEFLKLELEDVVRSTMEKYNSLTLRASSVFYRDKTDEYLTRMTGFSDDLLKTLNFIKLQRADGGGDYPEAVDKALGMAIDSLHWNKNTRTKILFLILDAPPHKEAIERIQQLTVKAAARGIRIVPIACSGTDKSTEFLLRSMALATNGTYTFLTNNSGLGNNHIEPTTDKYEVELLNNLLQRIIGEFLFAGDCGNEKTTEVQQPGVKHPDNILSVKVYPNPASGQITIESNKAIKELFITDFTGKILMRIDDKDKSGKWKVDISNYPSGAYLVKYITTDNKWGAEKVILIR